ncbi:MAG TPA: GTP cyclohydrolase FolE2 [Casimicrobiaceae bacterium]|nr:GTP cyclohydrolase FolE2 [Casimicrobiaceae bacterium]
MNRPETPSRLMPIPDVQSGRDERRIAIDQVGIKGLRYPLPFADGDGAVRTIVATCNVYVALPEHRKGTHMSRLVELLEERALPGATPLSVAGLRGFVADLVERLDAPGGRIELAFPYFLRKVAPISGVASLLDYDLRLTAELLDGRYASTIGVSVPVTSLCPCSKEISDYGAHNQRSLVTIVVQPREPVSVAELLRVAEDEASSELYGILKRADEKYVTERAYDNPRFVEDLVRGVALRLAADPRIGAYAVEAENFESIHNHSAYARISRGC